MEFRRIMIATDFSPGADEAFGEGLRLASRQNAELLVINVLPAKLGPNPVVSRVLPENDAKATRDKILAACRAEMENRYMWRAKGLKAEGLVTSGDPAKILAEKAEDWRADLLVMGASGAAHLRERFFGSVSMRLTRRAPCSVLVVRSCPEQ